MPSSARKKKNAAHPLWWDEQQEAARRACPLVPALVRPAAVPTGRSHRGRPSFTSYFCIFFLNDTATTEIYTLSLHDALPISSCTATTCSTNTSPVRTSTSTCAK